MNQKKTKSAKSKAIPIWKKPIFFIPILLLSVSVLTFGFGGSDKTKEFNDKKQSLKTVVETNLAENYGIMSFKPMDIMATPQTLMKVWIDEPIPVDFYSDKEKEVQKLINEKTTDGIITYSPLDKEKEWTSVDYEEITPFTWKWVDFELPKPDGTLTKINLRRPHWWLKEIGADSVGKKVYLNMPELGSQGWATVTAIRVNQLDTRFWDENRDGDYVSRPITGKFTHESNDVYNLHFGDNTKPLGVTGSHPIWSIDRNDWVGATDLEIGEKVKTQEGEVILKSKEKVEGRHKVYNLEIYKDHNFLVSTDKILVHNSCIVNTSKVRSKILDHAFSEKHIKGGIMDLGKSKDAITDATISIIEKNKSKLIEGSNEIVTKMNGHTATVRAFVKDGEVISGNVFKGTSSRTIGNVITD